MQYILNVQRKKPVSQKPSIRQSYFSKLKAKTFPDKQKPREFIANRPTLQEILKKVLQAESKLYQTIIETHTQKTRGTSKGNYVGNLRYYNCTFFLLSSFN